MVKFACIIEKMVIISGHHAGLYVSVLFALISICIVLAILQLRIIFRDRQSLADALRKIGEGEYSLSKMQDASGHFSEIKSALEEMVPKVEMKIDRLKWDASHDSLTGLLNSDGFRSCCQETLERGFGSGALFYCHIDNFEDLNASVGHAIANHFISIIADRIRVAGTCPQSQLGRIRASVADEPIDNTLIGRIGSDEFVIFLVGEPTREELQHFVRTLVRLIEEPCQIGVHSLRATTSVGVALGNEHFGVYEQIFAAANTALYESKIGDGGAVRFYSPSMREKAARIIDREIELRDALNRDEFVLYYQPQLDLATNRISGAEALIRWQHPTRGLLQPDSFIPFAEAYGLINDIGDWVIQTAISSAAQWNLDGLDLHVAINVSPAQLARVELLAHVRACLQRFQLPARALQIEFTEQAVMTVDEVLLTRLNALRAEGIVTALDDFGTGYSNLVQLLAVPLDRVKLDRSLLEAIDGNANGKLVISTAVQLAKQLQLEVVAEGVETICQLDFLREIDCEFAQGYFIARPFPEGEFIALAKAQQFPQKMEQAQ